VKVSPDLRVARVYYSMIGTDEEKLKTQQGLDAAKGYVRREVTSRVQLRVSPEVFFTFDGSLEEGDKIERLLKEVKAKEGW
jgi:ribosome-binding factor A